MKAAWIGRSRYESADPGKHPGKQFGWQTHANPSSRTQPIWPVLTFQISNDDAAIPLASIAPAACDFIFFHRIDVIGNFKTKQLQ